MYTLYLYIPMDTHHHYALPSTASILLLWLQLVTTYLNVNAIEIICSRDPFFSLWSYQPTVCVYTDMQHLCSKGND